MSDERLILGIDPGLNITGYGILNVASSVPQIVEAGVIRSKRTEDLPMRLKSIHDGVADVISSFTLNAIAMEELYSHYARPTTAIMMGHARGVLCLAAGQAGLPIHSYAATQVKKMLTGNGRAGKDQVQRAITRHLNLSEIPDPPDVADALAIGLCHFYLSQRPASLT